MLFENITISEQLTRVNPTISTMINNNMVAARTNNNLRIPRIAFNIYSNKMIIFVTVSESLREGF